MLKNSLLVVILTTLPRYLQIQLNLQSASQSYPPVANSNQNYKKNIKMSFGVLYIYK